VSGGFKRSGVFGLVGVFAVAALAIVIATTMGEGQANPKLALGLIFGVIALFCVILFALQRSDLTRAAGGDAATTNRAAAQGGRQEAALPVVPNSTRWKRLEVGGGAEGIVVTRKKGDQRDWLCDLWLAERLASH
jgi:hypothetical protein